MKRPVLIQIKHLPEDPKRKQLPAERSIFQFLNRTGVDRRKQPDAAAARLPDRRKVLRLRNLVDRKPLRVHAAQHHRDADGLWAEREHVRVVSKLHLRPALAAHGELTALVDDRDAQCAVLTVAERQNADKVAQQRCLSPARRREDERAAKPILEQLRQKRIALGHKPDDHELEQQQGFSMKFHM